ncbi:MAG: heme o synthase [Acidimicrobiales bacterium]|nr:heme o synthase [Acidimicrobiales bacterium]
MTATHTSSVRDYVALTKPRIIELLLVTTVPVMVLAAPGWPGTALVAATVLGGTLSAGGANVLNMVWDRDIDAAMERTASRPLVTGAIPVTNALVFGLALGALGHGVLWWQVGAAAAWLTTGALGFYVVVYTMILKRRTAQNIVIGGIAGAVPVLVGWVAVTGELSSAAFALFLVVCLWTPPHFWALAIHYREDYRGVGVPMLPVVAGIDRTLSQIRLYTWATVLVSLTPMSGDDVGAVYGIGAIAAGVWFITAAYQLDEERAMRFFRVSITYLAVVFAAVGAQGVWSGI